MQVLVQHHTGVQLEFAGSLQPTGLEEGFVGDDAAAALYRRANRKSQANIAATVFMGR